MTNRVIRAHENTEGFTVQVDNYVPTGHTYHRVVISPFMTIYWALDGDIVHGTMYLPKAIWLNVFNQETADWLAATRPLLPEEVRAYANIDVRRATLFNRDTFFETPILVTTLSLETILKKPLLPPASDVHRPRNY